MCFLVVKLMKRSKMRPEVDTIATEFLKLKWFYFFTVTLVRRVFLTILMILLARNTNGIEPCHSLHKE
jgi:hypothetical protein